MLMETSLASAAASIEVVDLVWKGLRQGIAKSGDFVAILIEVVDLVWKGLRLSFPPSAECFRGSY